MEVTPELHLAVSQLLGREAAFLDHRRWEDWLELYTEDCVYWVPSWANEEETVTDPELCLNLMYLQGREALGDRVYRIQTRDSFASVPLDRTAHVVASIHVGEVTERAVHVTAGFVVHSYGIYGATTRGGVYEMELVGPLKDLKIERKKVTLLDDRLETPVDIYHL